MYSFANYNFAVSENIKTEQALTKRFGKPSMIVTCPDDIFQKEYIFVYKNNHMDNVFQY